MHLVIDATDYRRLSTATRDELLAVLEGRAIEPRPAKGNPGGARST